jgi:hypothetical protein
LLCHFCNVAYGCLNESPEIIENLLRIAREDAVLKQE